MNLLGEAPLWAQLVLVAILFVAAAQDIVRRQISNWLCLAVMIAAIPVIVAIGPSLALWQNGLIFALLLAIGTALFSAGWLGGGDVKLVAALGLWTNLTAMLPLLACILIAGGVLAAVSLVVRSQRPARRAGGVPYGVAIAVGASVVLLQPTLFEAKSQPASSLDLKAARAVAR